MTQATRKLTFAEYVQLDADDWVRLGLPEGRCEYEDGELRAVPSESGLNDAIANYLFFMLVSFGIPLPLVRPHSCEIEVSGIPRTRYPDLVVLREDHLNLTQRRLLVTRDLPPPQLVVEVVSPKPDQRKRDWVDKRKQYAERSIPEYWLVDPAQQKITVLWLEGGQYVEWAVFEGDQAIASPNFGILPFTADQALQAGAS
jgi:Uma2 family endonuclease